MTIKMHHMKMMITMHDDEDDHDEDDHDEDDHDDEGCVNVTSEWQQVQALQ